MFEQTVVLLARTTGYTIVCQECLQDLGADNYFEAAVSGTLRLEQDLSWTNCARGHRIRLVRAGRTEVEPTSPLW
jgi:hypothetical protein